MVVEAIVKQTAQTLQILALRVALEDENVFVEDKNETRREMVKKNVHLQHNLAVKEGVLRRENIPWENIKMLHSLKPIRSQVTVP